MNYNTKPRRPVHPLAITDARRRGQLEARKELLLETLSFALPEVCALLGLPYEPDELERQFRAWQAEGRAEARRREARERGGR